ncbi:MAG: Rdx family protein [Syntrophorhabdus sp. PtaU1.Bin050]|nr:MAG: Rdx family protein [Syntrophorhabdus sp. PtaU1.Bin050]
MEAELKAAYPDSHIELIRGDGGIFDVKCDGISIYSKHNTKEQRFPNEGEIAKLIKEKVG